MAVMTEENTSTVTLTAIAAEKLREIMAEKSLDATYALRVFVSGGGCSGLQYGMAFDDKPRPIDVQLEQQGLRMVIDPQSLGLMSGASIDYIDSPTGGGFHIDNPNAASGCGCGQSSQDDGAGGGCSGCH